MEKINVFTDGGARGNPGPSAIGVYIENEKGEEIHSFGKKIEPGTNNVAEYTAVVEALSWVLENKKNIRASSINFFLDSNLVCSQLNGLFRIKNARLRELLFRIRELEGETKMTINYSHVPREKNQKADRLVNMALDSPSGIA